jgi:hypothetical protein
MKAFLSMTVVAAAVAGFAGLAQAQVPTAQSQYNGVTPRPAVEGRLTSTTRSGAVTPDEFNRGRSGYVRYGNARPAWGGPMMVYPDDQMETATVMAPSALVTAPGPSMQWKWSQCAKLYPTFDPRTGTFLGEDGLVHLCQ